MSPWYFTTAHCILLFITALRINHGSSYEVTIGNKTEIAELQEQLMKMVLSASEGPQNNNMSAIERSHILRQGLSNIFGNFSLSSLKEEISQSMTTQMTCKSCNLGVGLIKLALSVGTRPDGVGAIFLHFCIIFKIQPDKVCQGLIDSYKDQVLFVLSRTQLTTLEICAAAVGADCGVLSRRQWWKVKLPPKSKPPITGRSKSQEISSLYSGLQIILKEALLYSKVNSPTWNILHISDTHIDHLYKAGSEADCAEMLCCQNDSVAGNTSRPAGKWGDFGKCDLPRQTIQDMLQFIALNHKVEFVIWTGDIPPHDVWKQTRPEQLAYIDQTMRMMRRFFPRTVVLPVMGNHESVPANIFPPSTPENSRIPEKFSISWLYEALLNQWKVWLPKSTHSTILKGGYYAVQVKPGLRVISLNTNFCYSFNWWLMLSFVDPADQLRWLVNNLQDAEDKKEKVYIIGHIPPGSVDCTKVWSANFYNIINRYENTVIAQFYGHTHTDEFEVFYDQKNRKRAINVAYIGPSVTTNVGLNPAFRLYKVAGDQSHKILDHETYMMDLDEANSIGRPFWKKLYSAKESYKMSSLHPQEWSNLVNRMKNSQSLFDQFYRYYHRESSHFPPCSQSCQKDMVCALQSGRSHDPKLCIK